MTNAIRLRKMKVACFVFFLLFSTHSVGQIKWPAGQLLPSFPAVAPVLDLITLRGNSPVASAELYLFASLKGLVNKTKPRIFSYEGDAYGEGPHTWLQSLDLKWLEPADKWDLITKYRKEISGLIVYDPAQIHTVNLATVLAKSKNALIVSPLLLSKLTAAPHNLPVLIDLQGKFASKLEVYKSLYDTHWPQLDRRLLIGLNPNAHKAALREYAVALGAAVVWLDPKVKGESELLDKFLSSMAPGASFMGWWPEEEHQSMALRPSPAIGVLT